MSSRRRFSVQGNDSAPRLYIFSYSTQLGMKFQMLIGIKYREFQFFFSRMLFFLFLSFFLYALTSVGHQTGLGMRGQKGINGNKRSEQIRKKSSCSKMLKYQLTSVSRKNFMLRLVGHGISFITWGPGCQEIPFYIEHCKRLF